MKARVMEVFSLIRMVKFVGWLVVVLIPLCTVFFYQNEQRSQYEGSNKRIYERVQRYIEKVDRLPVSEKIEKQLFYEFVKEKLNDRIITMSEYKEIVSQYEGILARKASAGLFEELNNIDN